MFYQNISFLLLLSLLLLSPALPAAGSESDDGVIGAFSWLGDGAVDLSIGYALTQSGSIRDRRAGKEAINAILTAGATAQALKLLTHQRRPPREPWEGRYVPSKRFDAFPSGHTSTAFALATVMSHERPRHKWWYYGLAALVAISRVEIDAHSVHDVLGGAIVGVWSGYQARHGKGLLPFLRIEF